MLWQHTTYRGSKKVKVHTHDRWYMGVLVAFALLVSAMSWSVPVTEATSSSKRLSVPFLTQLGSAGVPGKGGMNCGPASIAMSMQFFGKSASVHDAAIAMRGHNYEGQIGTDFKSQATKNYLSQSGLQVANVQNYDQVKQQISNGNPVVILVNTYKYRSIKPYLSDDNGWYTTHHIVVVTGYDSNNVWLHDPLRTQGALQMSVSMFKQAAEVHGWYAVAVHKNGNGGSNDGGGSVPSTPRGLKIKDIKSNKAKIDWDSQSGVKYFCVNWSRDNVTPQGCDVKVDGNNSSYKPSDLKSKRTYYVWVQACNSSGVCSSAVKTEFRTK
jgi:uncharacterized protein YvpB